MLAPASDRYEGRVIKTGGAAAVLSFVALYWINDWLYGMPLDPLLLLLEAGAIGAAISLLFARVARLRRLLIPKWRMSAAVNVVAHSIFSEENICLTKDRNAVLLYVSVLEGEMRLMPDIGVRQKVHDAKLGEIEAHLANAEHGDPTDLVVNALNELAQCCKKCFPHRDDDENELPDRPQIRLP
ncbi:MAG: hypothetical protein K8I27_15630 [Planctomycetes bacterium]|nr:hypothetical protein [Planctomycetota bacterium]